MSSVYPFTEQHRSFLDGYDASRSRDTSKKGLLRTMNGPDNHQCCSLFAHDRPDACEVGRLPVLDCDAGRRCGESSGEVLLLMTGLGAGDRIVEDL